MNPEISGVTQIAGVIGDPVSQSLSPAIWNAGFSQAQMDWRFLAFPVAAGQVASALAGVRALKIAGVSVTMPHKSDAALACDELDDTASALSSVNLVRLVGTKLLGTSTDGSGFISALTDQGIDPASSRVVVFGAGAAARAITHALGSLGADVVVVARNEEKSKKVANLAPGAKVEKIDALDQAVMTADVLVNATPLGMGESGTSVPVANEALAQLKLVFDTVYHPAQTPLIQQAKSLGVATTNGLGMLVHQAACSFTLLTGVAAPIAAMRSAVGQ